MADKKPTPGKPVIYQLVVRYFGNINLTNKTNGTLAENGCGKFADINPAALRELKRLGVTHVWLTGIPRQATLTDHSGIGLPADSANIVKGIAGSFYSVRDYLDVCPDYASDPANRMQEFTALVDRIHDAGMQVLIDLVPNHVSRAYFSDSHPATSFGRGDDTTQFFSNQNHFFYLVSPPGQKLELSSPSSWRPPGLVFDSAFAAEDGAPGRPPKATGNNCANPRPSITDWYETIKLNYGFDFAAQQGTYAPRPRTWDAVDAILAHWQSKGVDGFRCDFAHYVPAEAWEYLIARARQRGPAYFIAEAYPYPGSGDPVHSQEQLVRAGFDGVYHYQTYNALKGIYLEGRIEDYDREMAGLSAHMRPHLIGYLENHDERRVASPIASGHGPGESGFGSAEAGRQLAPLQFLGGPGAVMLLNGQETGEPGGGAAGFAGDNGRTTIFDYWAMTEFAKWVNGHRYDGGGLSPAQKALRDYYRDLLAVCQHPAVAGEGYWGLWYHNQPSRYADCPWGLYPFARFCNGAGAALVVAANFRPNAGIAGPLRLPAELCAAAGLRARLSIELVLDHHGAAKVAVGSMSVDEVIAKGFPVAIANQSSCVYAIRPG
jgi:glycosidase